MSKTPTKEMIEAAQEAYATFGQVGHLRAQPPAESVVAAMLSAALQSAAEAPSPQPHMTAYDPHRYAVTSSDYSRPYLLGAYPTLDKAELAQGGKPDKWDIFVKVDAPAPQPREDRL